MTLQNESSKIKPISAAFMIAWVVYLVWSATTGQGLCGYVQSLQFQYLGESHTKLTMILSFLPGIVLLPISFKLDTSLGERFQISGAVGLVLFFLSIPVAGFVGWQYLERTDNLEKILELQSVQLQIDKPVGLKNPGSLNLIHLEGAYLVDATYGIESERGGTTTLYCPLVASDYQGEAIQFVFADTTKYINLPSVGRFININQAQGLEPAIFEGIAKPGDVPVYVRQEWEKSGLELGENVYILDFRHLVDGKVSGQPQIPYVWAFYGSIIFAVFVGGAVALGKMIRGIRTR